MQLRDHPGMEFHGVSNWPPIWVHARGDAYKSLKGEIGILKFVYASNGISNKCYLVMEHEDTKYVGCLIFNSPTFCYQLANLLRYQVGRSIKELGDLDISELS